MTMKLEMALRREGGLNREPAAAIFNWSSGFANVYQPLMHFPMVAAMVMPQSALHFGRLDSQVVW
jgi:hypothetical protein